MWGPSGVQAARQGPLDSLSAAGQPSWLAQQTLFGVFAEQYYSYSNQDGQSPKYVYFQLLLIQIIISLLLLMFLLTISLNYLIL